VSKGKYTVLIKYYAEVEVEADSEDEAFEFALDDAHSLSVWQLDMDEATITNFVEESE
jgi:hypothetical protein